MRRMPKRIVRAVLGTLLVLVSYPMIMASGGLWLIAQHRDPGGAYTATTQQVHTDGYAMVIEDVDRLLRSDAPFARGGQTPLRLSVSGPGGPLFVGLAPQTAVRRYLAGTAYTKIDRVRIARGPLPVDTTTVFGPATPTGLPFGQEFWVTSATGLTRAGQAEDPLRWVPSAVRGQHLSLVVMNALATPTMDVKISVAITPTWLVPMIWGLLVFSGMLLAIGLALMIVSGRSRKTLYVLDDDRLSTLATRLRSAAPIDQPETPPAESVAGPEPSSKVAQRQAAEVPVASGRIAGGTPRNSSRSRFLAGGGGAVRGPRHPVVEHGPNPTAGATQPVVQSPAASAEPLTWAALLATARPPATPRLMWPPKRVDRPAAAAAAESDLPATAETAQSSHKVILEKAAVPEEKQAPSHPKSEVAPDLVPAELATVISSPVTTDARVDSDPVLAESVTTAKSETSEDGSETPDTEGGEHPGEAVDAECAAAAR
jgi:hypothetical protein